MRVRGGACSGEAPLQVEDGAAHRGLYDARSVVEAHDENASIMRDLAPEVLIARYGHGGLIEELLEEPWSPWQKAVSLLSTQWLVIRGI